MERPPAGLARPVVSEAPASVARDKVLLASDGGVASAAALRWVLDYVGLRPAEVEIVDVVDLVTKADVDATRRRRSVEGMAGLLRLFVPGLRVAVARPDDADSALEGSPGALVVIGVHRRDRVHSRLVEHALDRAAGPVVIVPSEWISGRGPVIVGVGAEDAPSSALAFAEKEAAALRTGLRLIHAWETTGPGEIPPEWDFGTDSIPERQRRALAQFARREERSHPDLPITAEAVQGRLVKKLAAAARTASLLVVGQSHRPALARALFGSPERGLLDQLPCPVAIVP